MYTRYPIVARAKFLAYNEIPHLANLAQKYLAIPASSVTSERTFKVAKFASKYKFWLKAVNLERISFLGYNLEALGHPLLHEMKTPPPGLQKPTGPLKFTHFQSDNAPDQVDTRITQFTARAGHPDDNIQPSTSAASASSRQPSATRSDTWNTVTSIQTANNKIGTRITVTIGSDIELDG